MPITAPSDFRHDDSGRPRLRVTGEAAARFLHGFCTADINALEDGQATEAFFPSVKGRVLGYGVVRRDGDAFEIAVFADDAAPLVEHLNKYAVLDPVTIESDTRVRTLAGSGEGSEWPFGGLREKTGSGERSEVWDGLRVALGVPVVGVDLTEKNIVQEAGRTAFAVSFTKGCYLGQEPIARLDAMGHTNKELRVLRFDGVADVRPGDAVLCTAKPAGEVTSVAAWEGRTVALAMLKTFANGEGTEVQTGGATASVALPSA